MENPFDIDGSCTSSQRMDREDTSETNDSLPQELPQSVSDADEPRKKLSPRDRAIITLYTERLWTTVKIGNEYGLTAGAVNSILRRNGIPLRPVTFRPETQEPLSPTHRTLASNIAYLTDVKGVELPLGRRKIERLRSGLAEITLTELLKLAQALGLDIADLLKKDLHAIAS